MTEAEGGAFKCTGCGAALEIRAQGFSESLVCSHCGSILDARDPQHKVFGKYRAAMKHEPTIPLGTKGELRGDKWQAIGYLRRKVRYYDVDYDWAEYLLYNPFKGYRWLLESGGHWTLLAPLPAAPVEKRG